MIKAIYVSNKDGYWDYVASFNDNLEESDNWIKEIVEYLKYGDKKVKVTETEILSDTCGIIVTLKPKDRKKK